MENFGNRFADNIQSISETTTLFLEELNWNLLDGNSKSRESISNRFTGNFEITDFDYLLLNELIENCRISNSGLAKKLEVNPSKVKERMEIMEKHDVVLKFRAIISFAKLGYSKYKVYLYLDFSISDPIEKVTKYLRHKKEVVYIIRKISDEKINFEMLVRSVDEFYENMKSIQNDCSELINDYDYVTFGESIRPQKLLYK